MNLADAAAQAPATGRVAGRLQTILVLAITAAVIAVAAFLLGGQGKADGVTSVTLTADVAGSAPVPGAIPPGFSAVTYDGKTVSL